MPSKVVDGAGSVPKPIFLGVAAGWATGFLGMKVDKAAATAVGGGIILLQFANHQGYLNINWNSINTDVKRISKEIQNDASGKKEDWSDKLENKLNKVADKAENALHRGEKDSRHWYNKVVYGEDLKVKELQVFYAAYAVGVGLGVLTGGLTSWSRE